MTQFQNPRATRREMMTSVGRCRGGQLVPVAAVAVRPSEGGMLSQNISFELEPIAGRLITPIYAEMHSVFVPVQALDALKNPETDYAGLTEVVREKLLSGNPLFNLEPENEISKRCGIRPVSIGGVLQVSEMIRLAHNCAVNFLRQRKYVKASKLLANSVAITPALIAQTVLDRFNGVLDPDDRINGAVQLDFPTQKLPVQGITRVGGQGAVTGATAQYAGATTHASLGSGANQMRFDIGTTGTGIYAQLDGQTAGQISLGDLLNAEKSDSLVRTMRKIVDENPEYGEEYLLRWAHGLSIDTGATPVLLHEERVSFTPQIVPAMDTNGVQNDVMRSDTSGRMSFVVPVPHTELGGIIITFASIKPDETVGGQPHPILTQPWGLDNFVADELVLDPVPVTMRDLASDIPAASESTVAFYAGNHGLKRLYVDYGFNRQIDPSTVENKTAVWQLRVPLSVTPDNILYPENLDHYPFGFQNGDVATFTVSTSAVIQTPTIFGPTPVEALAIIDAEDIFEENDDV